MYTKQEIILRKIREGKSQRQISRELGISRRTVKKYLESNEAYQKSDIHQKGTLVNHLTQPLVYDSSKRTKRRLIQEIQEIIDGLLEENRRKAQEGMGKQLLKKRDILEILWDQGYEIGYTTVCNYIKEREKPQGVKEAYIRQEYQPGDTCEFDWGEVKLIIGGIRMNLNMSVFTSAYSNYRYGSLYRRQATLSFMETHVEFFSHVGGVYREMLYDNMRVAVARFVGRKEKEPTRALLQLRGHYQFTHRFCNAYRGNEKGHVERSVEYVRRKVFGMKSEFDTLEDARRYLEERLEKLNGTIQQLTGKTAKQMLEEERSALLPVKAPLACSESVELRVDKYSTISYGTNRYSVPDHLVGKFTDAKIYSDKLEIYYQNDLISIHQRSYDRHQWIIKVDHYLNTFRVKPGALAGSVALTRSGYLKELYEKFFEENPRDFIDLLHYCQKHQVDGESLEVSVNRLLKHTPGKITGEKIMALLGNKSRVTTAFGDTDRETVERAKEQLQQVAQMLM